MAGLEEGRGLFSLNVTGSMARGSRRVNRIAQEFLKNAIAAALGLDAGTDRIYETALTCAKPVSPDSPGKIVERAMRFVYGDGVVRDLAKARDVLVKGWRGNLDNRQSFVESLAGLGYTAGFAIRDGLSPLLCADLENVAQSLVGCRLEKSLCAEAARFWRDF